MTLTLRYAARSDRGLIREGNQDSVYAGPRLLAVADGMGGMAAGDIASNLAIAAMSQLDEDVPGDALVDALRGAVDSANQNLRDAIDANPALEGMGTTLTGMLFSGTKIALVHVGDSRAYLLRGDEFTQVTKDDTYVQMLVDEGRITEEEASVHPQRSLLIRALQGSDVDPTYSVRPAVAGDRYLICSDGLSGPVSDDSIAATLKEYPDPDECAERLLQLALRGGGPDNITVIVADVTDQDIIEGRPVVGGAASNDRSIKERIESTPATRASALTPRAATAEADEDADPESAEDPKRHPGRTLLLLGVVLVILAGGLWYGWSYTQSRYYVGVTDANEVAIYQGVPGKIVGLHLSSVYRTTDLTLDELTTADQALVKQTIPVGSLTDANQAVDKLRTDQTGELGAPTGCASPSPSPGPSDSPSLAPSPGAPTGTPAGTGRATSTPTSGATTRPPADGRTTSVPTGPTPVPSTPSVPVGPSPSPSC
ncbi:MAG TPA: protein phosphatase 2C domain-containing protein [Micromonosporaceae bacterium]|jgi:protein phosphatase|nr:protein phosphatase 2C domain-containing protein [Micromonosporaceae bacterium]